MARAELSPGIESLSGKLAGWSQFQARFKKWKDDSGHVIKVGPRRFLSGEHGIMRRVRELKLSWLRRGYGVRFAGRRAQS